MKRIVIMLAIIGSLLACVGFANSKREMGDYYPRAFVVSQMDYARDMVIVPDAVGFEWEFEEIEDWEVGDMVVAIMSTNGTDILTDDYFVKIQFAGYINPIEYWEN